jgi:cephalosporin-C deacetylase-like acetyl esterase
MNDNRPAGFDGYWQDVLDELALYPPRVEVEAIPIRTNDSATMYGLRFTSLGSYRIFAYLSIPVGDGPFPAIYWVPGSGSVISPIPQGSASQLRSRFVAFSLAARGFRNADKPYAAAFPGLLTDGIEDPGAYRFRGIAADCVRGLEVLLSRPEVDAGRVVVQGGDLALFTAALGKGATHLVCTPSTFYRALGAAKGTDSEIADHLRQNPGSEAAVAETLSYFDPRWFAPRVTARTLVQTAPPGGFLDRDGLSSLLSAFPDQPDVYESQQSNYKDGMFVEHWVSDRFGFDAPILPEHWRG